MKMTEGHTSKAPTLRHMACEQDLLSAPDGSAQLHQGDTCVLSAVYGPTEVKINKEILDRATVDVTYKPKIGLPGCAEKFQENLIRNTCDSVIVGTLHPKTAINVVIQEMQNSGSLLSTCINSSCLALMDAGVPLKYLVAAVSCVLSKDEGVVLLDPTLKQEEDAEACLTFVFDSIDHNIITVTTEGIFTQAQFHQCSLACKEASKDVFDFYREAVKRKLSKFSCVA